MVVGLCAAIIRPNPDILLGHRRSDCATAVHDRSRTAVQVCQLELERTQDPTIGVLLARALYAGDDHVGAKRMAARWLATSARSDALQLLGQIARGEDRDDDAMTALDQARALHRMEQNPKQLAIDDGMLAMIRVDRSQFSEALQLVDECITQAQLDGDTSLQVYCHLTAAKTLIQVGYLGAAEREIKIATPLAVSDRERSDLAYQGGSYRQEVGDHASAIPLLMKALGFREGSRDNLWIIKTELNLAYSLAETGQIAEARRHLDTATRLDVDNKKDRGRTWVAAQIAYREHELPRAASLTDTYFRLLGGDDSVDRDEQIDLAILRALIELERGDLQSAEQWARRGVDQAEDIRTRQSVLELRPWVLAKWRAPYELLFTARARSHQVKAAAMAFDQWQGRTVQDALVRPRPPASLDYRGVADQVTRLGTWLRVASQASFARKPDQESVLRTMRDIDLLALIVADGDVWRLTAHHGPPQLSRVGSFADVKERVDLFRGHATDVEQASRLGALLLPDDAFRKTGEVLHVVLDGQLGGLPVAALRRGTTPLIAMRPVVRLLRLPETRCAPVIRSGHATVLAVPDDTARNMLVEAEQVAALLHTTSQTGADATKAALFAAASDAVLHVAAHGEIREGKEIKEGEEIRTGGSIVLADGEVSALEISARGGAPSLVVLSACQTAASDTDDSELARSLASGFLGAGSHHVVATLRPIFDTGALEIITRFYREGGVADPARALATAQSELVDTTNRDWPYFVVFVPDVCPESAPDR